MKVDRKKTSEARKRQKDGIAVLNRIFAFDPLRIPDRPPLSPRTRATTPPDRSPRQKKRHRLRKLARAARRRNR